MSSDDITRVHNLECPTAMQSRHEALLNEIRSGIGEIRERMARGDVHMQTYQQTAETVASHTAALVEIKTKMSIIWAGLGIAGVSAMSALGTALWGLLSKGAP